MNRHPVWLATLAAPSMRSSSAESVALANVTPRLVLALSRLALWFASLVCSAKAVRHRDHAGFVGGMPLQSEARRRRAKAGGASVRRAGLLDRRGLRYLILVGPVLASLPHPFAGPVAAAVVRAVPWGFDRAGAN